MLARLLMVVIVLLVILFISFILNRFIATLVFTLPALGLGFVAGFVAATILFLKVGE
jgi:hypothetical protein